MIEITVRPDHVTVNGHARHGPPGEDIVCAAVSALTLTLSESLRALTADTVRIVEDNGYISIWYRNLSESGKLLVELYYGVKMPYSITLSDSGKIIMEG